MKVRHNFLFFFLELGLKISTILLIFSALRITFYGIHASLFPIETFSDGLSILINALRFDLSALCYVNFLLILSYLLPIPHRRKQGYKRMQRWLFVTFNGIAIIFEMVDIAYFPYVLRRSNAGDLALAGNSSNLIPLFLREYWYLLLVFVFVLLFLWWSFEKWSFPYPTAAYSFVSQLVVFVLAIPLFFVGIRGGIQLRPLMPLNAQQYVPDKQLAPLMYPTTLSLLFSTQQKFIREKHYFSDEELEQFFPVHQQYQSKDQKSPKPNIVLIVLESFGQEYSTYFAKRKYGFTPFLDSLAKQSLHFEHAFANGMRSTQGIAALSASIPALMEDPYLFSAYQSNNINGVGTLLKKEGYTSAFFHGANPGSMEFEGFSKLCGFDYYLDRRSFNNDAFYDGYWGIWDRPFFQYTAKTLDGFPEPFFAQVFSLTSHHPYAVEPFFLRKHPDNYKVNRSIKYTDDALRRFFKTASKMDWFEHTLFVITADHTGSSLISTYQTAVGRYMIPMLFYQPGSDLQGRQKGIVQQIDILPSIMDFIGAEIPFASFGRSIFDSLEHRYAYFYFDQIYRIVDERFVLLFDGEESIGFYDYVEDIRMKKDLSLQFPVERKRLEQQLKAVLQQHHNRLIRNELSE